MYSTQSNLPFFLLKKTTKNLTECNIVVVPNNTQQPTKNLSSRASLSSDLKRDNLSKRSKSLIEQNQNIRNNPEEVLALAKYSDLTVPNQFLDLFNTCSNQLKSNKDFCLKYFEIVCLKDKRKAQSIFFSFPNEIQDDLFFIMNAIERHPGIYKSLSSKQKKEIDKAGYYFTGQSLKKR